MKRYERFAVLLAALSIIALMPRSSAAQKKEPAAKASTAVEARTKEATPELRRRTFEVVWRTIYEKHFDPNFNGVDWKKIHRLYAPRVSRVRNDKEFYGLLQQMLNELHQSHFVVLSPDQARAEGQSGGESVEADVGLRVRIMENEAVIWRVIEGSPAATAGLRPGFVIRGVGNDSVEQMAAAIARRGQSTIEASSRLLDELEEKFLGPPGSSVLIKYSGEDDRVREVVLRRDNTGGEMSPPLGSFPSLRTEFESKRLEGGIGYIRFNFFLPVFNRRIREAVRSMADAPGLVIDLRGNPGGFDGVGGGLAGLLMDKQTVLGTSRSREGHENYVVYPQKNPYGGPVVILIDGESGSASESFSGGMQAVGRALVVGETSSGGDLDAAIDKLPTGALLLHAVADFVTAKGVSLEGRGVVPDIEVKLTRAALLSGTDPQLEAAVRYIKSKGQKSGLSARD